MLWPNWDGVIYWEGNAKEKNRLLDSYKKLHKKITNLKRNAKKKGIDVEDHPDFLALENEVFISSDKYEKLFPKITIQS